MMALKAPRIWSSWALLLLVTVTPPAIAAKTHHNIVAPRISTTHHYIEQTNDDGYALDAEQPKTTLCTFPAAATTGDGLYVSGKTETDAAVQYMIAIEGGGRRWRVAPIGAHITVLSMIPPWIWEPRERKSVLAEFHRIWPKMPTNGLFSGGAKESYQGEGWMSKILDSRGVGHWIVGHNFIDAPTLGGPLEDGPTSCTTSRHDTSPVQPQPDATASTTPVPVPKIIVSLMRSQDGTNDVITIKPNTYSYVIGQEHDQGYIDDLGFDGIHLSFQMHSEQRANCNYQVSAVLHQGGAVSGHYVGCKTGILEPLTTPSR